jgi:dTDP-4-amino-4,6-dideoxygalactose transaminase
MSSVVNKNSERIYLSAPHMSGREIELIKQAFASNYIAPVGPQLSQFEEQFREKTGFEHSVAVTNGTTAIHLMLHCIGIKRGDVVLASTLTFIGSVCGANYLGADLGFVDCDAATWCMDPNLLEEEIKQLLAKGIKPAAVLPTDNYGQPCDIDRLVEICSPHGIPVVCDCAETMGARYRDRHTGKGATAAAFSFNGNKIITTSGGGMVASDDKSIVDYARHLSTQAREPGIQYEHSEVGYNYRLSNILAALGLAQFEVLDDRVKRKREIYDKYVEELGDVRGITFMPEADYGQGNRWLTAALVDESTFGTGPQGVIDALEKENIEARPVWYPMHLQKIFASCRVSGGKVAESIHRQGICLPSGTAMSDADIERICGIIRELKKSHSKPHFKA